jgi:hypothetical protein
MRTVCERQAAVSALLIAILGVASIAAWVTSFDAVATVESGLTAQNCVAVAGIVATLHADNWTIEDNHSKSAPPARRSSSRKSPRQVIRAMAGSPSPIAAVVCDRGVTAFFTPEPAEATPRVVRLCRLLL